jgi:integrase
MTREKTDGLPQYLYARGQRLWMRIQENGAWTRKKTPYLVNQVVEATRYVAAAMRVIEERRVAQSRKELDAVGLLVRAYAERWLQERQDRELPAALDDRSRLDHALPHLGHLQMDEVRPRHLRDMVRALCALKGDNKLAPRTIRHVYMCMHNVFETAVVEEIIGSNPCRAKAVKDALPRKVDADPEWRPQATFITREVEELISSSLIPVERRVQYALKAIAGLRHGEVAALMWRHLDPVAEPLARLHVVRAYNSRLARVKSTKTEESRKVPVHPVLAKILAAWKLSHWERIYGRAPKDDDYVVPTRTMRPVAAKDAGDAMKRDLRALGLRVEAGENRDRGGHDLRAWYKTQAIEDGADSLIVRQTTHAPPRDVNAGYERFSWAAICREVGKLRVSLLDGNVLEFGTSSAQAESKARNRWQKLVTPMGLEPDDFSLVSELLEENSSTRQGTTGRDKPLRVPAFGTAATMLEKAARTGDLPRVLEIAAQMREIARR